MTAPNPSERRRRMPVVSGGIVCLVVSVWLTAPRAADQAISLVDVAEEAGLRLLNVHGNAAKDYIVDSNGNGAAWFDYDNDRDLDALIVNGSTRERIEAGGDRMVALYENDGRGTFTDVTELAGVGDARWSMNCAFGDYDLDGDLDLYVVNHLTFDDRAIPGRDASVCQHVDLDVYCGPRGLSGEPDRLYRNDGDGTFTDVTERAGIEDPGYYGFGVLFSDLDADGWPDIFVANDSVPNLWFRNNGDGSFSEDGLVRGLALNSEGREQAAMGVGAGDFNGDGRLDLFITNFSEDYNTLYENDPPGVFTDVTYEVGLGTASWWRLGWGTGFVDIDNDGLLDVFVANGHVYPDVGTLNRGATYRQSNQLFRNLGGRRFEDISQDAGPGLGVERSSRGAAFGDYDNDGDVDALVINMNERPTLLRNELGGGNNWLTIRLVGTGVNRDGIGAIVRVTADGRTQAREVRSGGSYLSHHDIRAHFGLGKAAHVDQVEILWPGGRLETLAGVEVNHFYEAREGTGRLVRSDR